VVNFEFAAILEKLNALEKPTDSAVASTIQFTEPPTARFLFFLA
jgi:hypothetical protein